MKNKIEYVFVVTSILSFLGLSILCFAQIENVYLLEKYVSIYCIFTFIVVVLLDNSEYLFSLYFKWFHQVKECIKKKVLAKCTRIVESLEEKPNNTEKLDLLSPTKLKKSKYVDLLKSAVDDERVFNIAIMGPYGSGKSTIIKTFQAHYPKHKCLNLSLASFAEEQEYTPITEEQEPAQITNETLEGDGTDNPNSKETTTRKQKNEAKIDINKLEYSLVQQFFYHVKAKEIPDSRFGRILRISKGSKMLIATLIVAILIFIYAIFNYHQLATSFSEITDYLDEILIKYFLVFLFIFVLIFLFYKVVGYICNMSSGHIKLLNYEIELQKDMGISIFNRYLDELVYMFQQTKYELVILEDLDRFNNTSIYTKLRELNLLLNNSNDINHRIVFIYALGDKVFKTASDRTKFFDYIIPVIPHVNVSNSASNFVEKFKGLIRDDENESGLDKSVLADIAPFIGDFRIIKAIVSDFNVNRFFLDKDLNLNNLLAMIVYKNLNPQDYEQLHEGKGPIKEIFDNKIKLIEGERNRIQEKISNIEKEIRESEEENLRSIDELRSVVLGAAARCMPVGHSLLNFTNNNISFNDINTDEKIIELLEGHYHSFDRYYRSNNANITKDSLIKILGKDFDYDERKKQIEHKISVTNRKLNTQRESLQKQLDALLKKSVYELCIDNPYLLKKSGLFKDNILLEFLIRKGYIDEKYIYYITIFKEGILTQGDNDYLKAIKSLGASEDDEFGRHLDDPNSILPSIDPSDFKSNKILNFELAHAIIIGDDENNKQLLIAKLAEGGTLNLDFISRYAFTLFTDDGLLKFISAAYPRLWDDVSDETLFSNEARLNLFINLMNFAEVKDIEKMNSNGQVEQYLSLQYYEDIFNGISVTKAKNIIKVISPSFEKLQDDRQSTNLFDFIYGNEYYGLNKSNVLLILGIFGEINIIDYDGAIYSAIKDSNILILNEQVETHIDFFVNTLVLDDDNVNEHESSFILLLNNEKLSFETKKKLILHNKTIIEEVEHVQDNELQYMLYDNIKVKASLDNIRYYYQERESAMLDEIICKFINENENSLKNELAAEVKIDNLHIIKAILFTPSIKESIAKMILDDERYKYLWIDEIGSLKESLVIYLINGKKIDYSVERFKSIGILHKGLYSRLLKQYAKEVIDNLEKYAFTTDNILILLNYPEYLPYRHNLVDAIKSETLTTAIQANKLLDYFISSDSMFEHNLYFKALGLSDSKIKKMAASIEYINHGFLLPEGYNTYFGLMGEGFENLNSPGEIFVIRKSQEAETFINILDAIGVLGHRTDSKNEFKAYVKKRQN